MWFVVGICVEVDVVEWGTGELNNWVSPADSCISTLSLVMLSTWFRLSCVAPRGGVRCVSVHISCLSMGFDAQGAQRHRVSQNPTLRSPGGPICLLRCFRP